MRTAAALAAIMAMAQPAMAATSLCMETARAGMQWDRTSKSWSEKTFDLRQYVVKEVAADQGMCSFGMTDKPTVPAQYPGTSYACYSIAAVGKEAAYTDISACEILWHAADDITSIECNAGAFKFLPDGGFWKLEMTGVLDISEAPEAGYGPATLSVGKCSVIEP